MTFCRAILLSFYTSLKISEYRFIVYYLLSTSFDICNDSVCFFCAFDTVVFCIISITLKIICKYYKQVLYVYIISISNKYIIL